MTRTRTQGGLMRHPCLQSPPPLLKLRLSLQLLWHLQRLCHADRRVTTPRRPRWMQQEGTSRTWLFAARCQGGMIG